jgi:hypothetical protein
VSQLDELVWTDVCEVLLHPACLTEALQRAQGWQWLPQELQARREEVKAIVANIKATVSDQGMILAGVPSIKTVLSRWGATALRAVRLLVEWFISCPPSRFSFVPSTM